MVEKRVLWSQDEIIVACALVVRNGWRGLRTTDKRVVDLSELLRSSALARDGVLVGEKFRDRNGVQRKTFDLATRHWDYKGKRTKGGKLDDRVVEDFRADSEGMLAVADEIRRAMQSREPFGWFSEDTDAGLFDAREGRALFARHMRRERNGSLRRRKLAQVRVAGSPTACEVCDFDFGVTYGHRGVDYIEVHHVLPLHVSGETTTRIDDLALLCANCHRMIHRGDPWLTPNQLRDLVLRVAAK